VIDFFRPVDIAWAKMEECLFKPFDIGKWFVLGFTAWLASFLEGGGGGGGGLNSSADRGGSSGKDEIALQALHDAGNKILEWGLPTLLILILAAFLILSMFGLLFVWLGARGQFMFLDNFLHGRAEVVKPWNEFHREGNSFFFFYAGVGMAVLMAAFLFVAGVLVFVWPDLAAHRLRGVSYYGPLLGGAALFFLIFALVGIFLFLLREFGIPMMHRDRISALEAAGRVWKLGCAKPLDFLVYLLMRFVMILLFVMLNCLAICLTCCIGCLPYLNSVVTLPLSVFRQGYTVECLSKISGESYWPPAAQPPPLPPLPPRMTV